MDIQCIWPDCKIVVNGIAACEHSQDCKPKTNPCIKGMTVDTCRFNPILGCDCGANAPRRGNLPDQCNYPTCECSTECYFDKGLVRDFCQSCGANVPPKRGEGTCIKCDPEGVINNPLNIT